MKKVMSLFALVGLFAFAGCSKNKKAEHHAYAGKKEHKMKKDHKMHAKKDHKAPAKKAHAKMHEPVKSSPCRPCNKKMN